MGGAQKATGPQDAESIDTNSVGVITSSKALSDKVHPATYISSLLKKQLFNMSEGGCFCGNVRYSVSGEPVTTVGFLIPS